MFLFTLFLFASGRGGRTERERERTLITNFMFLSAILFSILYNLYSWSGKCLLLNVERRCLHLMLRRDWVGLKWKDLWFMIFSYPGAAVLSPTGWALGEIFLSFSPVPHIGILWILWDQVSSQVAAEWASELLGCLDFWKSPWQKLRTGAWLHPSPGKSFPTVRPWSLLVEQPGPLCKTPRRKEALYWSVSMVQGEFYMLFCGCVNYWGISANT